jgi:hypothetical protein
MQKVAEQRQVIASDFSPRSAVWRRGESRSDGMCLRGVCTCRRSAAYGCSLNSILGLKSEAIT